MSNGLYKTLSVHNSSFKNDSDSSDSDTEIQFHDSCVETIRQSPAKTIYIVKNRTFSPKRILAMYKPGTSELIALKTFRKDYDCYCDDGGHHLIKLENHGIARTIIASTENETEIKVTYPIH